ncbi:MarR family winged helix-turn-helix transcriptional regulator [Streptomyces sp. AC627_RSS907]|uniref:MarR family winged helix-turn-helix transcriptional regulator n=1 Tax=Streptomyces sp. AC627_RSS907 TaxID=2823684 RepID=UPI001C23C436|nr:MarR family transcriptional regulator [Streptomyces sp. AC627_RSS907]
MTHRQDGPRHEPEAGAFPEDPLSHALYIAARASASLYRPRLAGLGLTQPQFLVLQVLWKHGAVTSQQLGEELHLDSGTLSPLLRRMEQAGLVSRRRARWDERLVEVVATRQAEALREPARHVAEAVRAERPPLSSAYEDLVRVLYELASPPQETPDEAPATAA